MNLRAASSKPAGRPFQGRPLGRRGWSIGTEESLEQFENFPLAPGNNTKTPSWPRYRWHEWPARADARYTAKLRHHDANILGTFRHLDLHHRFHAQEIAIDVGNRGNVVRSVVVGNALDVGSILADLLTPLCK